MVLDSKINQVKEEYRIISIDDWRLIAPSQVTLLDGVGPVTLDHIRLYLAGHGVTLKNDATPEYWKSHLSRSRIGHTMGANDVCDVSPFTILIDSMEQKPFTFEGMKADASQRGREIIVPTKWKQLGVRNGRVYEPRGDYSIDGFEGQVHVERKSGPDAQSTILGWGERRERFEKELAVLAGMHCSAIVCECSLGALIANAPSRGKKSPQQNAKILHRQVIAWQQDFRVPWFFCDSRRLAEITTFRILSRFWRKTQESEVEKRKNKGVTNEHDAGHAGVN